jgi:hypothetical protein
MVLYSSGRGAVAPADPQKAIPPRETPRETTAGLPAT